MKSEPPSSPGLPSLQSLLASPASSDAGSQSHENNAPSVYDTYPPISQEEMNVIAGADITIDDIWTQSKEDELQQWWNGTQTKAAINELREKVPSKGFMTNHSLWRISARIFKQSPLELLRTWQLIYDTDLQAAALPAEGTSPEGSAMLSIAFGRNLTGILCHPLLLALGANVASRAIMTALQFAVLCRTNDRTGIWIIPDRSHLRCPVVIALAEELSTSLEGGESIHERHERIRRTLDVEPSILSNLLHEIGRRSRRHDEDGPAVARKSYHGRTVFLVETSDVRILCGALDAVDPAGAKCDDAFKKFRHSHERAPWPSQLPTRHQFCSLLEKAVLDGERFWRRRELENRPPAPVASPTPRQEAESVARQNTPLPEERPSRTRHWSSSPSEGESWPRFDDERYRIVISRTTGEMVVSRMPPMADDPQETS